MRENMADAATKTTTRPSWEGGLDRVDSGGRRRRLWILLLLLDPGRCGSVDVAAELLAACRGRSDDDDDSIVIS